MTPLPRCLRRYVSISYSYVTNESRYDSAVTGASVSRWVLVGAVKGKFFTDAATITGRWLVLKK